MDIRKEVQPEPDDSDEIRWKKAEIRTLIGEIGSDLTAANINSDEFWSFTNKILSKVLWLPGPLWKIPLVALIVPWGLYKAIKGTIDQYRR